MINVLAAMAAIAVVVGLSAVLYGWFKLSLKRFDGVVARDLLTRWDTELAELSQDAQERERAQPPVEVLEAILALPSPRQWRVQLSYAR